MIVHRRDAKGRPREVGLNDAEKLMCELYNIQLDLGKGCQDALTALTGPDIPSTLRQENPVLDAILTPDFVEWLVC
jgi:hypothetical protein